MEKKKDALGNDIDVGGETIYGYAGNYNGINRVWIGLAKKETNCGVTLEVIQHRSGAYGVLKEDKEGGGWTQKVPKSVNVKSVMLFPIHIDFLRNLF